MRKLSSFRILVLFRNARCGAAMILSLKSENAWYSKRSWKSKSLWTQVNLSSVWGVIVCESDFLQYLMANLICVFFLGQATFNIFFIWSGEVGCYLEEKSLQKRLKPNESFGELAVTFNRSCKTSYKALETSQIYVLSKGDIPSILKDFEKQNQLRLVVPRLKTCSLFSEWDLGSMSFLFYLSQEQVFMKN